MNYLKKFDLILSHHVPGFYPSEICFEFREKRYFKFVKWVEEYDTSLKVIRIFWQKNGVCVSYKKVYFTIKNKNAV